MDAQAARSSPSGAEITDPFIAHVVDAVRRGKRVRRRLDGGGRIHIDRKLPYLLLYRFRGDEPERGIQDLLSSESAYLVFPADEQSHGKLQELASKLGEMLSSEFGAFLLLEVWPADSSTTFVIHAPQTGAGSTIKELERELLKVREVHVEAAVEERYGDARHAPYAMPVLSSDQCKEWGILTLGLEIPPLFKSPESGQMFPVFHRVLRRYVSRALREAVYDFIRVQTNCELASVHMLGQKSLDGAVWHVDQKLAAIESSYPYLLLILPVNSDHAWQEFRAGSYERPPQFHYRLLPVDPEELKRRLYNINIGSIEDHALAQLLREKREELDIQITMLSERNTPKFLYSSIRLYRGVEAELLRAAQGILATIPPPTPAGKTQQWVDAEEFRRAAEAEFEYFRRQYPAIPSRIEVRNDISGLMVSHGNLLIDSRLKIRPERLEALLQHEVGTHVLTYCNGRAQPLRQLYTGLDDYDELQEGLAVLAEYLVGRLDRARMRLLGARVVAAHCQVEGATFVDTFRELRNTYGFQPRTCFDVATRIYASGGFIKDVIYLRGLMSLMDYLKGGHPLETLYVGKIALKHVPVIEELRARQILKEIPLKPRFLTTPEGQKRLREVREGLLVTGLVS
jgi:uncharacterized protein (TIGR02421 family)